MNKVSCVLLLSSVLFLSKDNYSKFEKCTLSHCCVSQTYFIRLLLVCRLCSLCEKTFFNRF